MAYDIERAVKILDGTESVNVQGELNLDVRWPVNGIKDLITALEEAVAGSHTYEISKQPSAGIVLSVTLNQDAARDADSTRWYQVEVSFARHGSDGTIVVGGRPHREGFTKNMTPNIEWSGVKFSGQAGNDGLAELAGLIVAAKNQALSAPKRGPGEQ